MVATIDKSIAHKRANPKPTPASVQTVTVPGPINAAATNGPGPIFLNQFFNKIIIVLVKLQPQFLVGCLHLSLYHPDCSLPKDQELLDLIPY